MYRKYHMPLMKINEYELKLTINKLRKILNWPSNVTRIDFSLKIKREM